MSRPSPNPDARALKAVAYCPDGLYLVVADDGSKRVVIARYTGIASARRAAAQYAEKFPAIYVRLEGRWKRVN